MIRRRASPAAAGRGLDRHALLLEGVAVAQRDGVVLRRLVVDRDRERRPDLVLAPVAPADRAAVVVLRRHVAPQILVDRARLLRVPGLAQQREDRDLDGRERRVQAQHGAPLAADLVLVVGVAQEREDRAADAGGGLDHVGDVALARLRVDPVELLAGELRVLREVVVAAVRDPLELLPAGRVEELDVARRGGVVRQLVRVMRAQAQVVGIDAEPHVPVEPLAHPVLVPLVGLAGRDEVLHLHLLELERAEDEVAGRDLVAERLADLRDPERRPAARELQHLLEVEEDPLRGLGAQVDRRALLLDRADRRLEHQVERARLAQLATADRADEVVGRLTPRLGLLAQMVRAEPPLALAEALHERVGEAGEMPARLPRARVLDDRRVQRDDVVAVLDHRLPPLVRHVELQQHPVVAVVVGVGDPAVDLRGGEDETAPLAQRHDLLHGHELVGHSRP